MRQRGSSAIKPRPPRRADTVRTPSIRRQHDAGLPTATADRKTLREPKASTAIRLQYAWPCELLTAGAKCLGVK